MSLPKYEECKDSGVEWIGPVPAHWRTMKIGSFTRFCGGGTPSRENLSYWNGDIPWVSPKDMKAERISGAEEFITGAGLAASTSSMIDTGSLLMVVRSGILKHTIPVAINDVPVALNQDMKALRFAEESTTSAFFLRWVQGLNDLLLLAWAKQGATVESIEHTYLVETVVPLPPADEQAAITIFLDRETAKIDALIAEQEALLALLAKKRQATISHSVTRGLDPNAPMKHSGIAWLGTVPTHWEVRRVKDVARLESGHTPSKQVPEYWIDCDVPWVSLNDSKQLATTDYISDTAVKISAAGLANSSARLLPGGVVVFTRDATIGLAAITTTEMAVSQHLIAWCPSESLNALYLLRVFNSMKAHLESLTAGATIKTIGMDDIKALAMPFPPIEEQKKIVDWIEVEIRKVDAAAKEVALSIGLLKERRTALIAAAVTGQIDVRGMVTKREAA